MQEKMITSKAVRATQSKATLHRGLTVSYRDTAEAPTQTQKLDTLPFDESFAALIGSTKLSFVDNFREADSGPEDGFDPWTESYKDLKSLTFANSWANTRTD